MCTYCPFEENTISTGSPATKTAARDVWRSPRLLRNIWLATGSDIVAELLLQEPWDAATLDLQHGLFGLDRCLALLGILCRSAMLPLVRVTSLDPAEIGKVLDAGAHGVICPCIESADDAAALVRACRYPPEGTRSVTHYPPRAEHPSGPPELTRALAIAMIESKLGVEEIDNIVAVPGIDGIYIGPSDLGLSFAGKSGLDRVEPPILAALDTVFAAARRAGIRIGLHGGAVGYWTSWIYRGLSFVTVSTDIRILQEGNRRAFQSAYGKSD